MALDLQRGELDCPPTRPPVYLPQTMSKKANETLQDLVTCAVCLENLHHSRMLPCQHTFCLECLQSIAQVSKTVVCPQCRNEATLPKDGVLGLPSNRYVKTFLELLSLEDTSLEDPPRCAGCLTACDDAPCDHCNQTFCAVCRTGHVGSLRGQLGVILVKLEAAVAKLEQSKNSTK